MSKLTKREKQEVEQAAELFASLFHKWLLLPSALDSVFSVKIVKSGDPELPRLRVYTLPADPAEGASHE